MHFLNLRSLALKFGELKDLITDEDRDRIESEKPKNKEEEDRV